MRKIKALIALLSITALFMSTQVAGGAEKLSWRQQEILEFREKVHYCQGQLRVRQSPIQERIVRGGPPYRRWVLRLWRARHVFFCGEVRAMNANPVRAIRWVFGPHGDEAVYVSDCETGGTFSVWAKNGQYLGLFQMGEDERDAYGHGDTPLEQAFAAYDYFVDSGKDWSPWDPRCRP